MALATLPPEILLKIVSHPRGFEVERLARSCNKAVYSVCLRRMRSRMIARHEERVLVERFGSIHPIENMGRMDKETYEALGFEDTFGPFEHCPSTSFEYLDYDDSGLSWLWQLDDVTGKEMPSLWAHTPITTEVEQNLRIQVADLKVVILETFFEVMTSEKLYRRTSSSHADTQTWFEVGRRPCLLKCPPDVDKGAGGVILEFASDLEIKSRGLHLHPGPSKANVSSGCPGISTSISNEIIRSSKRTKGSSN